MATRLSRPEQTQRNRSLVLKAARKVFLARGYHGATLERIADEAGFSKGVVYSQFVDKADLFLALLEARIDSRAPERAQVVAELDGDRGLAAWLRQGMRVAQDEPEWGLLVIEFRIHAARHPALNRRYAELHSRTVTEVAQVFAQICERAEGTTQLDARELAEVVLAVGAGVELERAAEPGALPGTVVVNLITALVVQATSKRETAVPAEESGAA
jgi:AcrR family transcriptional regulator